MINSILSIKIPIILCYFVAVQKTRHWGIHSYFQDVHNMPVNKNRNSFTFEIVMYKRCFSMYYVLMLRFTYFSKMERFVERKPFHSIASSVFIISQDNLLGADAVLRARKRRKKMKGCLTLLNWANTGRRTRCSFSTQEENMWPGTNVWSGEKILDDL